MPIFILLGGLLFYTPAALYTYSPGENMDIDHISLEHGLSQSSVYDILQDSKGFLWFATEEGLNRYDGYNFVVYKREARNPNSLKNNWIWTVIEEPAGVLWIGTNGGGLHKFDLETNTFTNYQANSQDPNSLSHNVVYTISADPNGMLWVGTAKGLNRFNPKTETFKRYNHAPANPNSLSHDIVRVIYIDRSGILWIGTSGGGLNRLELKTGIFTHYLNEPPNKKSLSNNFIRAIYEDRTGALWIGTEGGGLNLFDRENQSFVRYLKGPNNPNSLSNNIVNAILEDADGALWIGCRVGLNIFDREKQSFSRFKGGNGKSADLSVSSIQSICGDQSGVLWIGTHLEGINKFTRSEKGFSHFHKKPNYSTSLSDNRVWAIREDHTGILWVGTGGGLNKSDPKREKFIHYQNEPGNPGSLSHDTVMAITADRSNTLWIGTYGGGLNKFHRKTGTFIRYGADPTNPNSLGNNTVMTIFEDSSGVLWLGTFGGLDRFDKKEETFSHYKHNPDEPKSISHNNVLSIYEDRSGGFWVGTFGGGLNRFDRDTGTFMRSGDGTIYCIGEDSTGTLWLGTDSGLKKYNRENNRFVHYGIKDGLPNEVIYGILEDEEGNLWLSTNNGLSVFNPQIRKFINFDTSDGLQSNEFNMGAFWKSKNGELLFGGINGFNAFFPKSIKVDPHPPPIVLTDLKIFNKSVRSGEEVNGVTVLKKDISRTGAIRLTHKHTVFSIEYAGLHYALPSKNQYAYKMEGLEKDWNEVGNRRFATYTYVPAGEYVFRVKGANHDGVWNEQGLSLKITIVPPFWKTGWFYFLCILALVLLVLGIHRLRVRQLKNQEKRLTQLVKERTKELEQANRYKSEFLARMSHEIRTPLNSILGFADLTLDTPINIEQKEFIKAIKQSGEALLILINEILDLSRIEAGQLFLEPIDFDPEVLAFNVCELMIPRIGGRPIEILCRIGDELPANVRGDASRFRQVITNLMGNAAKFTREGEIELTLDVEKKENNRIKLHTQVRDTGIGIAASQKELIFEAFQQADGSDTRKYEGTGLGLAISKQIAGAMQGDVWVESEPRKGSTFHFTAWMEISVKKTVKTLPPSIENRYTAGKKVLVVDDNPNCLKILEKMLISFGFSVSANSEAEEALPILLSAVEANDPFDLCILDIHMPGMTGYEVARQIRRHNNKEITHIPILAISSSVERCSGKYREVGFDAFLPKPIRRETLWEITYQLLEEKILKRNEKKQVPVMTQHSLMEDAKQSIRILMAEDNELNRKLANFVLSRAGYQLEMVTNGKEALERLFADPARFDLILMDIQMPQMNGKEAARKIREKGFSQIPIIAMTAASMKGDREKCIEAGMNDYISKPIKREALYQVIKKWVLDSKNRQ